MEHRYTEGGITYEYISDYDILVITKSGENRKDYEVQDLIENRCVYKTPVTVITHNIDFVNKMLTENQYFFTDIGKEGFLLYDAGNMPQAERKPLSPAEAKAIAQNYFDQWYHSAVNFLQMSIYAKSVGNLKKSAFVLHKAAERTYNAIILVYAGYKSKTHNLGKLKRYSKPFSEEPDAVFPEPGTIKQLWKVFKLEFPMDDPLHPRFHPDKKIILVNYETFVDLRNNRN